jgi:DNA-binding NarL/FixJ family response regulator
MIRLLIADDQDLVRTGFRMIVEGEQDLHVVAEAADGRAAVNLARQHQPDVVLMDIQMPVTDGIQATRELTADADGPRVLILTTFDLDEYVYSALQAGASGFLLKDTKADQLVEAIRTIHAGDALLAPSVTRRLIAHFAAQQARPPSPSTLLAVLTGREREILTLIATGLSNQEISGKLYISEGTVKTHIGRIFTKLDLRDRAQAVIAAYDAGLVSPARTAIRK